MPDSSSPAGDAESSSGLMLAIRKFFDPDHGERSLRAQLEEAIDEHEGENGEETPEHSGTGDLSLVELDNGVALAGEDGFGDDLLDERDSDEIGLSRRRNLVCKILLFPTILEESPGPNPFWRWPF